MPADDLLFRAKLAEQAERYDDMAELMRRLALSRTESLSAEERALLAIAFKNASGERRAAWRQLCAAERRHSDDRRRLAQVRHYKAHIEAELDLVCSQVLALLRDHVIPLEDPALHLRLRAALADLPIGVASPAAVDDAERAIAAAVTGALEPEPAPSDDAIVFWYKMTGDYRRFLAEVLADGCEARDREMCRALEAYATATALGRAVLAPGHPVRLGLALNYSAFCHDVLQMRTPACRLAETAFNEAVADLDQVDDGAVADALLVMQLLKDNLKNWTADDQDPDGGQPDSAR